MDKNSIESLAVWNKYDFSKKQYSYDILNFILHK